MNLYRRERKIEVSFFTIPIVLYLAWISACTAKQVPATWQGECVGRLAFSLPGPADVASMTADQFLRDSSDRAYKFDDGEAAFYSHFQYGAHVAMTGPLTESQIKTLMANQRERFQKVSKEVAAGSITAGDYSQLNIQKLNASDEGYGWKLFNASEIRYVAFLPVSGHAVRWSVSGSALQAPQIGEDFDKASRGVRSRRIFQIPPEKGVCMPHLFIQDNGDDSAGRLVAATYRLRDHPDVTIMLKDATATGVPSNGSDGQYSAISQSNYFWTQDYQQAKSVKSLLNGSHSKVKLAGQMGVETMFRIERENNTVDYGYLVVVRGDPIAKRDTPDLMMYVISNADNARKKGKAPISKDAFFAMAQSIAASVRHRDANR